MSGPELARHLVEINAEARVVFMSGYSDQLMGQESTLAPEMPFLQKPFTMEALLGTVRRVLDEGRAP